LTSSFNHVYVDHRHVYRHLLGSCCIHYTLKG
jgi:hypothetical protein